MSASAADYFMKVGDPGSATNLAAPGYTVGDTNITTEATTNWPTDTGCIFAIDKVDTVNGEEVRVPDSLSIFAGVVSGANSIIDMDFLAGTPQDYDAGAQTRVYILVSTQHTNRLMEGILEFANQDGTLKTAAVQAALNLGAADLNGWNALAYTPNSVTHLGNRSYSLVFNGQDLRPTLSPGTRLRTTRMVAAPDKCTSLNGTNQYWSKSSPGGMSFTDDFATAAWIKVNSYGVGRIASRYNGTSGWTFSLTADGVVELAGYNGGSGNNSYVRSRQAVPLNRWVHVAAQLDMSGFTVSDTTSYIMMDAVDVPAFVDRGGTNPTALVQAGNLEIGSMNGGSSAFFPGKIAQLAIFGSKVTQSAMAGYMNQGLAGNESGLVSAYSFNNSANDLNANANNLTANGSAAATNADSPYGGQADGTIGTTLDYGIVTSVSFSTNTTVVVQVPEGCTIPTSGGVSAVAYSANAAPYGFPKARRRWDVITLLRVDVSQTSPTLNTWVNLGNGKLNVPVGEWDMHATAAMYGSRLSAGVIDVKMTISTTTSSETDRSNSADIGANSVADYSAQADVNFPASVSTMTPYYLNMAAAASSLSSIWLFAGRSACYIRARNALL